MFQTFDIAIANDLNQLQKTRQEDPSGQRLQRAMDALNNAAELALHHWSSTADLAQRQQTMVLHEGFRAAAEIVNHVSQLTES